MTKLPWFHIDIELEKNTYYNSAWTGIKTPQEIEDRRFLDIMAKLVAEKMDEFDDQMFDAMSDAFVYGRGIAGPILGNMDTRLRGYDDGAGNKNDI